MWQGGSREEVRVSPCACMHGGGTGAGRRGPGGGREAILLPSTSQLTSTVMRYYIVYSI